MRGLHHATWRTVGRPQVFSLIWRRMLLLAYKFEGLSWRKEEMCSLWPQGDKVRITGWHLLGPRFVLILKKKHIHTIIWKLKLFQDNMGRFDAWKCFGQSCLIGRNVAEGIATSSLNYKTFKQYRNKMLFIGVQGLCLFLHLMSSWLGKDLPVYRRGAKYLSNKLLIVREIKKELRLNSSPSL